MDKKYLELWGDLIALKDLILSIFLIGGITMAAYFIAPKNNTSELFYGLIGAVIGFIITSIVVKPKRNVILHKDNLSQEESQL